MLSRELPRHSLKTRILLAALIVLVAGIWSLFLFASRVLREDITHLLGEQQRTTVAYVAGEIDKQIDGRIRALELIAESIPGEHLATPSRANQAFCKSPATQSKRCSDRAPVCWEPRSICQNTSSRITAVRDSAGTLNDTLGHDLGDLLLQQVAKRLAASVRDEDTVAGLGDDEFVVMLETLSDSMQEAAAHAEMVGEKIVAIPSPRKPA